MRLVSSNKVTSIHGMRKQCLSEASRVGQEDSGRIRFTSVLDPVLFSLQQVLSASESFVCLYSQVALL